MTPDTLEPHYPDTDEQFAALRARVKRLEAICLKLAKFRWGPTTHKHADWIGKVLEIAAEAREALEKK